MLCGLRNAFSKIAAARDALRQQQEASTALACAWHRKAFEQLRKASVPEVLLGNIVEFLTARSLASDGDVPVHAVTTACLSEVGFLADGIKKGRMRSEDVASCIIHPGEILIARSNTPELVGRVSLYEGVPSPIVATDLTIRMRCMDGAIPEYVTAYLSFLYQTGYWREVAGGASGSMKKITRGQLQRLPIPLPDVPEQMALAESLHKKVVATRAIQGLVADAREALAALPSAVIRRAFKGVD
jgi:type I restriction enzyme S subunit